MRAWRHLRRVGVRQLAAVLVAVVTLADATGNAALAQVDFLTDLLMSEEQEKQVAAQEHPRILEQFGGAYDDPGLTRYVQSLVDFLGQASARPDITYRVTILNSPIVNAFALPAGYLYVTRGLLALADSEAELAGVLAHEIGHVTARHTAQRYSRAVMAQGIVGLLGVLTRGTQLEGMADAAMPAAAMALQSFSREHEHEADMLGVRTMSRAGFDPYAMASFLAKLEAQTDLEAKLAGREGASDQFNLFATHPRTADRVARSIAQAHATAVYEPMTERELYLQKIDGMLYGDDPEQGFVRGQVFAHPELDLRFAVPEGFHLLNGQSAVIAQGPDGAVIRFDLAPGAPEQGDLPPERYIAEAWAKDQPLRELQRTTVSGFPAATAALSLQQQGGETELRLAAIQTAPGQIFRFLVAAPSTAAGALSAVAKETVESFRRLTAAEKAELKPYRLTTHRVAADESPDKLAQRLPYQRLQLDRFRILNGLRADQAMQPGQLVKLIVAD